jgi:hypothetical protein
LRSSRPGDLSTALRRGRQGRPAEGESLEVTAKLFLGVTGAYEKGLDEHLADPAVFTEIGGHRAARSGTSPTQSARLRGLGSFWVTARLSSFGKRQCAARVGRRGPGSLEWQIRTKLIDLGDQPWLA